MRFRLKLNPNLKSNFIYLPRDSPLCTNQSANGLHCTPIKLSDISGQTSRFFGWTGGFSSEDKTIEIGEELGMLCGYQDGMLIQA